MYLVFGYNHNGVIDRLYGTATEEMISLPVTREVVKFPTQFMCGARFPVEIARANSSGLPIVCYLKVGEKPVYD